MSGLKFTVNSFFEYKAKKEKITLLTAYDYSTARLLDEAGINAILVGDSLGMVIKGEPDTLSVTMDEMVYHCRCVCTGVKNAFVIGDMPFMSYQTGISDAVYNAGRLVKEGKVNAVKLEGGKNSAKAIEAIVNAQIPVMGHIGLTPQSVNAFGGFKVQGRDEKSAEAVIEDALAIQQAGAFAVVLEGIPEQLAKTITEKLEIPTIGIGAGQYCDGQVLVVNDMLGFYPDFTPKFVKRYANLSEAVLNAVKSYINEVRMGEFPSTEHTFSFSAPPQNKPEGKK